MRETCWYVFTHDIHTRVKHVISAILIQICILYTARILYTYIVSLHDKTQISTIYNTLSTWVFYPLLNMHVYNYKIMIKGIIVGY